MRSNPFSNPLWGFVALILVAIVVAGVASKKHPNNGTPTIAEQEQDQADAARKAAEASKNTTRKMAATDKADMKAFDQVKEGAVHATMEVEGKGKMQMELYPKAAPATVAHFVELAKQHFYDGLKFHRLERNPAPNISVLQGGDPESKDASVEEFQAKGIGQHGSGKTVPLEAHLPHTKYSIGLARSQAPDSGDSQFYINLENNNSLDGQYCIFGMIVQGQDVVDKIAKGDVIKSITIQ